MIPNRRTCRRVVTKGRGSLQGADGPFRVRSADAGQTQRPHQPNGLKRDGGETSAVKQIKTYQILKNGRLPSIRMVAVCGEGRGWPGAGGIWGQEELGASWDTPSRHLKSDRMFSDGSSTFIATYNEMLIETKHRHTRK